VDAVFERAGIHTARWVTCPDNAHLNEFVKANQGRLAKDVDGNYALPRRHRPGTCAWRWSAGRRCSPCHRANTGSNVLSIAQYLCQT